MAKPSPKTALVTGASAGIGEAVARRLLKEGYIVYAAARRVDRMATLEAAGARTLRLDVTEDDSILAAIARVRDESGRLDALVNNAGYGSYGALEEVAMEEARRQFEVNLFGAARLIQLALPMMRAQKRGRIVNISSIGGKFGEPFGSWYHASKYALEGLSDCLRQELHPLGIRVIVIEPGAIRTEWAGIAGEHLARASAGGPYAPWAMPHAQTLSDSHAIDSFASDPAIVARTVARSLRACRPRTRYATGGGAKTFMALTWLLSDRVKDRLVRRMFRAFAKAAKQE